MSHDMLSKRAVDQATKDYWTEYFGETGKQWTQDIPRRVTSALLQRVQPGIKRSAHVPRVQLGPLGYTETPQGGLVFEGVFRCVPHKTAAPIIRTFRAEFDAHGELCNLDQVA